MNRGEKTVDIAKLLSSFNLEIKMVPDNLKCTKCKFVLKDACQMVCGCRFCRVCIDDLQVSGAKFCPGGSEECDETSLLTTLPDYSANKSISKLIAKCPHAGCSHECILTSINDHLLVCTRKIINCPFRELGCQFDNLAFEDMNEHLQQNSLNHNNILIKMVVNLNRNMDILRRELVMKDEQVRHAENDIKSIMNEFKSIKDEIKSIEYENKSIKDENISIKYENNLINVENKLIKKEIKSIKNENKSIKEENISIKNEINSIKNEDKSIKEENISIKNENMLIKNHIISIKNENKLIKDDIKTTKNENGSMKKENKSIKEEIKLIKDKKENNQSKKGDINSSKSTIQSAQSLHAPLVVLQDETIGDEWLIYNDISKNSWSSIKSNWFTRMMYPYKYQLHSGNSIKGNGKLWIRLDVHASKGDPIMDWILDGTIIVIVSEKGKREIWCRLTQQCRIERPTNNKYHSSEPFVFPHTELKAAGLDLSRGICVSCLIIPIENK